MFGVVAASAPPVVKKQVGGKIYLCLNSLHASYAAVTGALTIDSTTSASHNSDLKLIIADDPGSRTGTLAPIAIDQKGTGVFKDEYKAGEDFNLRAQALIGNGPYAGKFYNIRPKQTYSTSDGSPTTVTSYGDADGLTFGDAYAGRTAWNTAKASLTGPLAVQFWGEHLLDDNAVDGAGFTIDFTGTTEVPILVRHVHPRTIHNDTMFDRAVIYGGKLIHKTAVTWNPDIVSMAYTEVTPLVEGDKGLVITMDTDGDTGTILDYDASNIWIGTDGAIGNEFDNTTPNDTFTITGGTGAGNQNGAASAVSNLYWRPSRPALNFGVVPFVRDLGSAWGNGVDIHKYESLTATDAQGDTVTKTLCTGPGLATELTMQSAIADVVSTEDSAMVVGAITEPLIVHIVGGADPTYRVATSSLGYGVSYGDASNIKTVGETYRGYDNTNDRSWPQDNWEMVDWSRMFGDRPFALNMAGWGSNRTGWLVHQGFMGEVTNGFYPNATSTGSGVLEQIELISLYGRNIGVGNYADGDGHLIGFQHTIQGFTARWCYSRNTGQAIHPYQSERWILDPLLHEWGDIIIEHNDLSNVGGTHQGLGADSADNGIHFGGDNVDESHLGNGKADPPTTNQSYTALVRYNRVRGFKNGVRNKWHGPNPVVITDNDIDDCDNGFRILGAFTEWAKVISVPYTAGTALVNGDVGKTITMDTDTDTGTIVDFDGSNIWVYTDGTAGNSFDNSPTANDTFTITTGTGTGSQNGVGVAEKVRAPNSQLRRNVFGSGNTTIFAIGVADSTSYVWDSDLNTFNALAASAVWDGDNYTTYQARSRSGDTYDPGSTRNDP